MIDFELDNRNKDNPDERVTLKVWFQGTEPRVDRVGHHVHLEWQEMLYDATDEYEVPGACGTAPNGEPCRLNRLTLIEEK